MKGCNMINWIKKMVADYKAAEQAEEDEAKWAMYQEELTTYHCLHVANEILNESAAQVTAKMYMELMASGVVTVDIDTVEVVGGTSRIYKLRCKRKDQGIVDAILHTYDSRIVYQ